MSTNGEGGGTHLNTIKHPLCRCYAPWVMERSLCIHDEILLGAPIEATDEVTHIAKETMEEAGRVLLKIVPVDAEVVVADSWDSPLIVVSLLSMVFYWRQYKRG